MDPKAEKYLAYSPYNYGKDNPVIFIDPNGEEVIISELNDKAHRKALKNMLETKQGRKFLGRYMKKGQNLKVGGKTYTFKSTGDRAKDNLWLRSSEMADNGLNRTFHKGTGDMLNETTRYHASVEKGVDQVIDLRIGLDKEKATMTLGHESFVHADKDADRLNKIDKKLKDGGYSDFGELLNDLADVSTSGDSDHNALGSGKVKKYQKYAEELSKEKNDPYFIKEYKRDVENH